MLVPTNHLPALGGYESIPTVANREKMHIVFLRIDTDGACLSLAAYTLLHSDPVQNHASGYSRD